MDSLLIACTLTLLVPYVLFPQFMRWLAPGNPEPTDLTDPNEWPTVDILFAAYNEVAVLDRKLQSMLVVDYPMEKLRIFVGSDCSDDGSEEILESFAKKHDNLHWVPMSKRSGKSAIINHLVDLSKGDVIIGTDANIFFDRQAVKAMVRTMMSDSAIDMVGGRLVYHGMRQATETGGIAREEKSYVDWENQLKSREGRLFGTAMGVEGGCYAIRRSAFVHIPHGTLMEDFFETMTCLKRGRKVVMAMDAICSEDVSHDATLEFKRKIRISQGNWQNLVRFWPVLFTKTFPLGMVFLCHKVLRWLSPFVALVAWGHLITINAWWLTAILVVIPHETLPSWLIQGMGPMAKLHRSFSHFVQMHIALLAGFFRYLRRRETGVWQPTTRRTHE